MITRRSMLAGGGSVAALLSVPYLRRTSARAAGTVDIVMRGTDQGAHVWFDPVGLLVAPGQTLLWRNDDRGNSHTVTAYHPDIGDRPLRWPAGADPFDSGYLLPGGSFSIMLTVPGIYDYYCVPHEHAGMVGRIIVAGGPHDPAALENGDIPEVALAAFPAVDEILAKGRVLHG